SLKARQSRDEKRKEPMPRFIALVIDSGGVGALSDAANYHDAPGANTIGNVSRSVGGLHLPTLQRWGFGNLTSIAGTPPVKERRARVARLREKSKGKDTITG